MLLELLQKLVSGTKNKFFLVGSIMICLLFFFTLDFVIDDAFITFRYGKILANYGKIAFNPEDPPTEGSTSFLWVLFSALIEKFKISPIIATKALSLILLLLLWNFITKIFKNSYSKFFFYFIIFLNPSTYIHGNSGMETLFFSIILLFLTYKLLYSEKKYKTLLLLLVLLSLTRPQGILISLLSITYLYLKKYKKLSKHLLYTYLLFMALLFLWKWFYYGDIFPSAFYIKFGNTLQSPKVLFSFLFHSLPLLFLIAIHGNWEKKIYTMFLYVSSMHFFMSNLIMNFSNRFLYHIFPSLTLISAEIFEQKNRSFKEALAFSIIGLAFFVDLNDVTLLSVYGWNMAHSYAILGKTLHNCSISHSYRKMLLGDVGLIGYFSDWYTLDYWGLGSVHFAKANDGERLKIVNQTRPSMLFLYSMNGVSPQTKHYFIPEQALKWYESTNISIKRTKNSHLCVFIIKKLPSQERDRVISCISEVSSYSKEKTIEPSLYINLKRIFEKIVHPHRILETVAMLS